MNVYFLLMGGIVIFATMSLCTKILQIISRLSGKFNRGSWYIVGIYFKVILFYF